MRKPAKVSPGPFADLEKSLRALTMEHLAKLAAYVPGPVKKQGTRKKLLAAYRQDPVFSIFGLDSLEYLAATLAGGTATSIHRKIGDIYEACVKTIFMQALKQSPSDVVYSTIIRSGEAEETRSADAYLQFDRLDARRGRGYRSTVWPRWQSSRRTPTST